MNWKRALPAVLVLPWACSRATEPSGQAGVSVSFVDATATSGVDFRSVCGSPEKKYILDGTGSGVALFDADLDGDLDLYFVDAASLEFAGRPDNPATNRLYRNDGGFRFSDATVSAGVGDNGFGLGAAVADVENDGDPDLYVTNWGKNVLYRNDLAAAGDLRFTDVTGESGTGSTGWSTSAAFADYDLDGDLDLYVVHYLEFDLDHPPAAASSWKGVRSFAGPMGLVPEPDVLFRNDGTGRFADVSVESGIRSVSPAFGLGAAWFDGDVDGDPDLYVANDTMPNFLFRNDDGRFSEIGVEAGAAFNGDGQAQAGMGVAVGDANGDGAEDLFVTNFSFDANSLYLGHGDLTFELATDAGDIARASWHPMGWGVGFLDVEADGDLDLLVANGHLYPEVDGAPTLAGLTSYGQKNHLFLNDGAARFRLVGAEAGPALQAEQSSRGLALGDLDGDGDVDAVITNIDDAPQLLRNDTPQGHWLRVRLEGTRANRSGIGARVLVTAGGKTLAREVRGGSSILSHSELDLHFGLGAAAVADVAVSWPGGGRTARMGVAAGTVLVLREGEP